MNENAKHTPERSLFTAASLDEVAALFDSKAIDAKAAQDRASNQRLAMRCKGESIAYEDAAYVVRHTTLNDADNARLLAVNAELVTGMNMSKTPITDALQEKFNTDWKEPRPDPDVSFLAAKHCDQAISHARRMEEERGELRGALTELLREVDSLESYTFTRDIEPYKAQAIFHDALVQARAILERVKP